MIDAQPIISQSRTNDEIQTRNIDNTKLRQTTGTQTWPDLNLGVTIETQTDTSLNNVTNVTKKVKAKVLKRPKSPPQERGLNSENRFKTTNKASGCEFVF